MDLSRVRVVLHRVRNPLNIGAVARAMANFGAGELVLVEPYAEAWREARSARAGAGVLHRARIAATLAEALAGCACVVGTTDGSRRTPEMPLEPWAAVAAALPPGPLALLFGSERTGLGVDEISFCHRLVRFPTLPESPSMNLGQAVAVCLYELARGEPVAAPAPAPIGAPERERILAAWYPIIMRLGVVREQHRASQTRRMRQMLIRWGLSPTDQRRMLGVARELRRLLHIPASPCIGVCRTGDDGFCVGCRRSLEEIAAWGGLTDAERRRIMKDVLPAREL